MLLRSAALSWSRRDSSVGSSSWKSDSCRAPSSSTVPAFRVSRARVMTFSPASSARRVFYAEAMISRGMPARRATWIPKLCATPPSLSLRRKMTSRPDSRTAIWKFFTRG